MAAEAAATRLPVAERVRVTEIFRSLQGESTLAGLPTVFVRLTGCPLRCVYCDSAYAFHGGSTCSLDEVMAEVGDRGTRHVCVTGGEPLAQRGCTGLLERLCDAGYSVSLETSGAIDISPVDARVVRVLDLKTPGSGECDRNLWSNIDHLTARDQVKFVICDRRDYEWALEIVRRYGLPSICEVLFSPVWETMAPRELADWIVADAAPVRFQLQLHKILWGDEPGR